MIRSLCESLHGIDPASQNGFRVALATGFTQKETIGLY